MALAPDRVTVLTCMGCGAMGRQQRCVACSEHKLVLVEAAELGKLLTAAHAARARAERMAPAVRRFADVVPEDVTGAEAELLRDAARRALRDAGHSGPEADWDAPDAVTGWWCAECGNVDLPQPCIGVCIWRPAEWVSLELYDRQRRLAEPGLRAAQALSVFLSLARVVTPRAGREQRHWQATRAQARAALSTYAPDATAPE